MGGSERGVMTTAERNQRRDAFLKRMSAEEADYPDGGIATPPPPGSNLTSAYDPYQPRDADGQWTDPANFDITWLDDDDLTSAGWEPEEHPRGADGRFIEAGAIVDLLKKAVASADDVSKAVGALDKKQWDNLKPAQRKHITDSASKLPAGSETRTKLANLGAKVGAERKAAPKVPQSSGKAVVPAIIYKKNADGTVVAVSPDGKKRMRWDAGSKKFIVEDQNGKRLDSLNKTSAYAAVKDSKRWVEPSQQNQAPEAEAPTPIEVPDESPPPLAVEPELTPVGDTEAPIATLPSPGPHGEVADAQVLLNYAKNHDNVIIARNFRSWDSAEKKWVSREEGAKWYAVTRNGGISIGMLNENGTMGDVYRHAAPEELAQAMKGDDWRYVDPEQVTAPAAPLSKKTKPVGWETEGNIIKPLAAAKMTSDVRKSWTVDQKHAILGYTQYSDAINAALRDDEDQINEYGVTMDTSEVTDLVDSAMHPMPQDITLFRRVGLAAFGISSLDDAQGLIGKTFSDKAYLSTSVNEKMEFDRTVHIKIYAPKGTMGAYVAPESEYPEQSEWLLARKSELEFTGVEIKGGRAFITARVVNNTEFGQNGTKIEPPEPPQAPEPEVPVVEPAANTEPEPTYETEVLHTPQPETPSAPTPPYEGPKVDLDQYISKDVQDRVRQIFVNSMLYDARVDERANELRKQFPKKYEGYDAWSRSRTDAVAELKVTAPDDPNTESVLEETFPGYGDNYLTRQYIRARLHSEAEVEVHLDEFARRNNIGPVTDEMKADLARRTREAFAGKKIAVRVTPKNLEHVLNSGRFKSQFESGKSKGKKDFDMRASVEKVLFGIMDKPHQNQEKRPIYGYVALDGVRPVGVGSGELGGVATDALSQYGNVQVILKDDVRRRTTALFGDSLNNMSEGLPSSVDDPSWRSFTPSRGGLTSEGLTGLDRSGDMPGFRSDSYAEAQIHGGVSVDDIEEVVLPSASAALQKALDDKGIRWRVLNWKNAPKVTESPEEREVFAKMAEEDIRAIDEKITWYHVTWPGDKLTPDLKKEIQKYEQLREQAVATAQALHAASKKVTK